MSRPGTNPNFGQVGHPIADLGALRTVCEQLKQNVDSLGGFRGDQLGRAVTFQDLIDMGVVDRLIATSPDGSATPPDGGQFGPTNPAGTAAATPGVMMGLKASFAPRRTGALFIAISGTIENDTAGKVTTVQMHVGLGALPSNGGGLVGESVAPAQGHKADAVSSPKGFCTQAIAFGLSLQATYWIDLALFVDGGTGSVKNLSVSIVEL